MVGLRASLWFLDTFFIIPNDDSGLGLIDSVTQGCTLVVKSIVCCVDRCAPWKNFLRCNLLIAQQSHKIMRSFKLCAIVLDPLRFHILGPFIIKSILVA